LSRDGARLAFRRSGRSPEDGLYVRSVEGAPDERRLAAIRPASNFFPLDWSPDGSLLLAGHATDGKVDIVAFSPDRTPGAEPRPLLASSDNETDARFSPDGLTLAFVSDESGRNEVYLAPYRADGSVGPAVAVSSGPGISPRWRPDGKALYFWDGQDRVFSVPVTTSPRLSAGPPEVQLDLPKLGLTEGFAVLPDGRLLVVAQGEEEGEIPRLDVVLGFASELERAGGKP
jgi:Tol biopolymer transport system component